jgi:hypothetical protein
MPSLNDALDYQFGQVLAIRDTQGANEALRGIMTEHGLGVAILVAWQHGIRVGHIPRSFNPNHDPLVPEVRVIKPDDDCPYKFVHVPVRQYRRSTDKLVEHSLLNPNADPALFVYHEDGLIGTFSFLHPESADLTEEGVAEILRALAQQGVLVPANVENRQIQFKDLDVKRRIEASGKQVYVRVDHHSLSRSKIRLPTGYEREDVWKYVFKTLQYKFACNYCSVNALSPLEVTLNSAHARTQDHPSDQQATVRNYQFGFTFAPIGNPDEVCHFLAWDFPHISDLVMNMEPQAYSFSDLIRLVKSINRDIAIFCRRNGVQPLPAQISGGCNHWAGNSIYHQHYQFFRLETLPLLLSNRPAEASITYQDVEVLRLPSSWPAPAFIIRSLRPGGDDDVMKVADSVAREWGMLSEGEDRSFGNEIVIKNHTQNILVTMDGENLTAVFVPRLRSRTSTARAGNPFQKLNAGVLEMMGYFVIDNPEDFGTLEEMSSSERKALGDSWLSELAPDEDTVKEFEDNVRVCLSTAVDPYEQRIDELLTNKTDNWRARAQNLVFSFQHDSQLNSKQREHLYRELVWAVLEATSEEPVQRPIE